MTFCDDGIRLLNLSDVPLSGKSVIAVREAASILATSPRVTLAEQMLAMPSDENAPRPVVLKRGVLIPENPPKRFLVQQPDLALDVFATQPALLTALAGWTGLDLEYYSGQLWVALVPPANYQPFMSQTWHRDPYDGKGGRIVKLFWYLDAVEGNAGPFEYIAGSQEREPPTGLSALDRYIGPIHHARLNRHPRRVVCTGPTDTMILCDTSGIHRGGHCLSKRRLSATMVYSA